MAKAKNKSPAPLGLADRAFYAAFRTRMKMLREKAKLTQEDLCDQVGIPLASYKHMEGSRASRFPLHKVDKLAKALRQSCDYVLTGRESRFSSEDDRQQSNE